MQQPDLSGQKYTYENGFICYQWVRIRKAILIKNNVLVIPVWIYYLVNNTAYISVFNIPAVLGR